MVAHLATQPLGLTAMLGTVLILAFKIPKEIPRIDLVSLLPIAIGARDLEIGWFVPSTVRKRNYVIDVMRAQLDWLTT